MPTQKFFIRFLSQHTSLTEDGQVLVLGRPVEYVWVQGVVIDFIIEDRELILDDGTGHITISTADVSYGENFLVSGAYVMVQGTVSVVTNDLGTSFAIINARLLYNLVRDVQLESLWQYEVVRALQTFFTGPVPA